MSEPGNHLNNPEVQSGQDDYYENMQIQRTKPVNVKRTIMVAICILHLGLAAATAQQDVASLVDQLGAWNKDKAKKASEELAAMGRKVVPELVEALHDGDYRRQRFAARSLRQIGQDAADAIPALIAALEYSDELTREYAVEALGKMANQADQVMPVLRKATKDDNRSVREHARASIAHLTGLLKSQEQGGPAQRPPAARNTNNNGVSKTEPPQSNVNDAENDTAALGSVSSAKQNLMTPIRCALFACLIAGFFTILYVYRGNNS